MNGYGREANAVQKFDNAEADQMAAATTDRMFNIRNRRSLCLQCILALLEQAIGQKAEKVFNSYNLVPS